MTILFFIVIVGILVGLTMMSSKKNESFVEVGNNQFVETKVYMMNNQVVTEIMFFTKDDNGTLKLNRKDGPAWSVVRDGVMTKELYVINGVEISKDTFLLLANISVDVLKF